MNPSIKKSRILGAAFLLQAIASLVSNAILYKPLLVDGDIAATLGKLARNDLLLRGAIFVDIVAALGIIWLGALLYAALRGQNQKMALTAFGFYLLEALVLAFSKLMDYGLLCISQQAAGPANSDALLSLGSLFLELAKYSYSLSTLPFCTGALLFYWLMFRSGIIARGLALWGFLATLPFLICVPLSLFGWQIPIYPYLPYVPFEFFIGGWILARGQSSAGSAPPKYAH